jgi:hypothetical protein
MSTREGVQANIDELLRNLGEEPLLREAEALGLSPRNRRMRCPFPGCADKGPTRERDAQIYAGNHPRVWCFRCETKGDLLDLLQLARGWSTQEAIAHLTGIPVPVAPAAPAARGAGRTVGGPRQAHAREVRRLWDAMARADEQGEKYLEGRGLEDGVELGLVRFATEQHPDKAIASQARRGYRIACC